MSRKVGSILGMLLAGMVLGAVLLGAARLALQPAAAAETHYHANWALFVDGQRLDLAHERYMEDVVRCKADPARVDPEDRVHMHNLDPDVVHVHHDGATWGHLLANIGFTVGDDFLYTDTGERYRATPERTLKFILNGREVPSIRNLLIESEDRLLISYGAETAEEAARTQFAQVATTAGAHNLLPDPGGCGAGAHAHGGERLRRAFWF
jgi:hypothetical protein